MKIIFAQGNPDLKYTKTRHNTGFLVVDAAADKFDATWKEVDKYKSRIAETTLNGEKVLIVKPLSYYNDTGLVARTLVDYYSLDPAKDFLVVHDDLALPLGTIRIRDSGSDAGNNGIKSRNQHLGPQYQRIRVGIWTEERNKMDDVRFVLGTFLKPEQEKLNADIIPRVITLIETFVAGTLETTSMSV